MAIETAISKTIYLKHYAYNLFALEVMTQSTSTPDNTLLIYWGRMLYLTSYLFDSIDSRQININLMNRDVMKYNQILKCVVVRILPNLHLMFISLRAASTFLS